MQDGARLRLGISQLELGSIRQMHLHLLAIRLPGAGRCDKRDTSDRSAAASAEVYTHRDSNTPHRPDLSEARRAKTQWKQGLVGKQRF